MSTALTFNGVQFEIIDRGGQPWVTSRQLSQALGYKDENSVRKIYERNQEEFSSMMTATVKMTVGITEVMVRIFSMRGCWLVSMLSRTPVAKAFRRWVLDVLETLEQPGARIDTPFITPDQQAQLHAIVDTKVGMLPAAARRRGYKEMWTRFNRHFRISRYVQLPAERMGDAVEYLVGMELRAGKTALSERKAPELPPAPRHDAPTVLKVTERECQALTDDITRAHIEAMRLLKPVKDRLSNIALRLAIETEQRAGMRALRHGEGESLQGMLFSGVGRMFAEAVMYPNERELPVYCNPGFFLLGICRQLRDGDRA